MSETTFLALVGLDVTVIIAALTAIWKLHSKLSSIEIKAAEDLAKFKIEAYEKFASYSTVANMEARIIEVINRLGDRLDRVLDRPRDQ
jgi:hypothetical protein